MLRTRRGGIAKRTHYMFFTSSRARRWRRFWSTLETTKYSCTTCAKGGCARAAHVCCGFKGRFTPTTRRTTRKMTADPAIIQPCL
eukprot:4650447-Prymnesium_polylepis.1